MSMPLDCYQSKPDYNSIIELRLPPEPPDRACWDELVSGDAVEAAVLLANLDNPYLTPGIGPGLVKQGKTAIKGDSYRKHEASQERHGRPDDQDE